MPRLLRSGRRDQSSPVQRLSFLLFLRFSAWPLSQELNFLICIADSQENNLKTLSQTFICHKKTKKKILKKWPASFLLLSQCSCNSLLSNFTGYMCCSEGLSLWFSSLSNLSCLSYFFFPVVCNILKTFTLTIMGNFITKILGMRTTELICFCLYLSLQNEWIAPFNENAVF